MSNVESAAAAGDRYNLRAALLADGTGAIVGAALGSPFPPAVYVGHKGWKEAGGRISYSLVSGIVIALLCFLGMFPLLSSILPIPAIVPVLLFIGLVIGGQAFAAVPKAYYAAVVLAMIPNLASWGAGLIEDTLSAAGTSVDKVGETALGNAGALHHGLATLGAGATLVGMLLGAIAVFTIDRQFLWAAGFSVIGAVLACFGLIHSAEVHWPEWNTIWLAYLMAGAVFLAFHFLGVPRREIDMTDPVDVADAALAQHARFNESEAAEKVAKEPVLA
jgi:AGZA family xanthine/uracil permease-like MFS transporter